MPKQSIPYWVKQHARNGNAREAIVEAAQVYARQGQHPQIAFEASPASSPQAAVLELATALYAEYTKKVGAIDGLYCTWRNVADKMAKSLNLQPNDTVLIPGLGLGALYEAARRAQPEVILVIVECQEWLVKIVEAAGIHAIHGDFLDGISIPITTRATLCNPPMGRLWGHAKIECEFLSKIAERSYTGDLTAILLPGQPGYFWDKLPKSYDWLSNAFEVKEAELIANPAAPKSIVVTRYLLERA